MGRISAEIRGLFEPSWEAPDTVERSFALMEKLKIPECDGIGLSPVSKMPAILVVFMQVGLRRGIELTEAAVREINQKHLSAASLLVRGTFETACLMWDVMREVEAVAKTGTTDQIEALSELLKKSLLGGKSKGWMLDDSIAARNVLTIIQRLSKQLDVPFDRFYEALSEHAHPNYHGMMATYTTTEFEAGFKVFCDCRPGRDQASLTSFVVALATATQVIIRSYEMLAANLKPVTLLAEQKVHEDGKWPAGEVYPVKRY